MTPHTRVIIDSATAWAALPMSLAFFDSGWRSREMRSIAASSSAGSFCRTDGPTNTLQPIIEKLGAVDVPVASILSMSEVTEDAYMRQRGAFRTVHDGIGGTMLLPADPTRFEPAPGTDLVPLLGEHRDEVLKTKLHLSDDDIRSLAQAGAFGKSQAH